MHSIKTALSRYGWFTAGVLLNAFGVALITKAALGTSPISSLPYVLSLRFPVTLGQFTFLMNMLFILAQVLLLRKDFRPVQLLQVAVNVVFSLFIDVSMGLLSWMEVGVLPMRLLALGVGCAVLGFGISVEVAPRVLMVPGEGDRPGHRSRHRPTVRQCKDGFRRHAGVHSPAPLPALLPSAPGSGDRHHFFRTGGWPVRGPL